MAKYGIGVGEEFPVDEPPQRQPTPESEEMLAERRRRMKHHHILHVATRLAVIALIVSFIVWMFMPHPIAIGAAAPAGYAFHRHFFFPFFPLLLIFVLAMAWRRRGCHRHSYHWHDGRRGYDREEV